MSNERNTVLLERAAELVDLALQALEDDWLGTTPGAVLDAKIAQVLSHIDHNNLDDLYNYSMPALENYLNELSRQHFYNNEILMDRDVY